MKDSFIRVKVEEMEEEKELKKPEEVENGKNSFIESQLKKQIGYLDGLRPVNSRTQSTTVVLNTLNSHSKNEDSGKRKLTFNNLPQTTGAASINSPTSLRLMRGHSMEDTKLRVGFTGQWRPA